MKTELVIHSFRENLHVLGARLRPRVRGFRKPKEQIQVEAPALQTVESFRTYSKCASIIAMVVGYHVFLGWTFDIGILKSPWPTFSTMKVNEAICSML
ncbi:MAG TPA: hypothetical protein VNT26_10320, partial [Candidatus Sulfotelmatobacter sp.]|nr:hypothetical protein [Candidatus Sulfotelmatobacter sp.]